MLDIIDEGFWPRGGCILNLLCLENIHFTVSCCLRVSGDIFASSGSILCFLSLSFVFLGDSALVPLKGIISKLEVLSLLIKSNAKEVRLISSKGVVFG